MSLRKFSGGGGGTVRPPSESSCTVLHVTQNESNIREVGRRLAAEVPDARVVLFGSHARGSATPRSDIDVLVIEPEVENTALESVRLMRAVRDLRLPAEVVVVSEREAAAWRDVRGSLVHTALAEGRVLA
jgi:predicted nucleotidyltransferase